VILSPFPPSPPFPLSVPQLISLADESADIERELQSLEVELRKLEAEYNMYFAGRLPRPPWESRKRVENAVKRIDRLYISNYGHRFKFNTLQSRFSSFVDLWDRGLRSREEGRAGPFAQPRPVSTEKSKDAPAKDGVISVTTFKDPTKEIDKLQELHTSLTEARRKAGQDAIPFQKFAELIKTQVASMTQKGTREVAFRVAVKDGKVTFTARGLKGSDE
jgi:hypothetical protein